MEISFNQGTDFQKLLSDCQQNHDHKKFAPAVKFTKENLPKRYQDSELFEFLQVMSELTVRLLVTTTSKERPQTLPGTQTLYPGLGLVGKECLRAGSGWVCSVTIYEETSKEPCPCSSCENSEIPQRVWGQIKVATANHVVFNTEEAKHTKIDLFFNKNAEESGTPMCTHIEGYKVWYSNISEDKCWLYCVTHDMELCAKLNKLVDHQKQLHPRINEKYERTKDAHLSVIISYPHGCDKQISMSQWASRELNIDSTWWAKVTYTPITCSGSSGAPVWSLGKKDIEPWRLRCIA